MPAFDTQWTGTTDGTWDTTGNWSGGEPVNNSRALIAASSQSIVGSDQSLVTLKELSLWFGSSRFNGSIGSDGNPLRINSEILRLAGSGVHSAWIDGDFDEIHVDLDTPKESHLILNTLVAGKTAGLLVVHRGKVTLGATCTVTRIELPNGNPEEAIVIASNGSTIAGGEQRGGVIESSGDVTTLQRTAGRFKLLAGTLAGLNNNGGNFEWWGGNLGLGHHRGGTFRAYGENPKVITDKLHMYEAPADLRDKVGRVSGIVRINGKAFPQVNAGVEVTL